MFYLFFDYDNVCSSRHRCLDICKRHGLELDEEPAYGGRAYLEKQDFIRMKQKEEIAHQDNMIEEQRKRVNENILQIVQQTRTVQENDKTIQKQEEKIAQVYAVLIVLPGREDY